MDLTEPRISLLESLKGIPISGINMFIAIFEWHAEIDDAEIKRQRKNTI